MITRPLDLASRLRPPPRLLDGLALFVLNAVLLGMFFILFGSRFVLSPGLSVDFSLPSMPGAYAGAATTPVVILVRDASFIITDEGRLNLAQLRTWLSGRAQGRTDLRMLVQADASVPSQDLFAVLELAREAGFQVHLAGEPARGAR